MSPGSPRPGPWPGPRTGPRLGPGPAAGRMAGAGGQHVGERPVGPARQPHAQHLARPAVHGPPGAGDLPAGQHWKPPKSGCPAQRLARQHLGRPGRHLGRGHALEHQVQRQHRDWPVANRPQRHGQQLVELGGPQRGRRHRAALDQPLAVQLDAVVAERDGVHADDRQVHQMTAGSGRPHRAEQAGGLGRVGAAHPPVGRGVHDQLGALSRRRPRPPRWPGRRRAFTPPRAAGTGPDPWPRSARIGTRCWPRVPLPPVTRMMLTLAVLSDSAYSAVFGLPRNSATANRRCPAPAPDWPASLRQRKIARRRVGVARI